MHREVRCGMLSVAACEGVFGVDIMAGARNPLSGEDGRCVDADSGVLGRSYGLVSSGEPRRAAITSNNPRLGIGTRESKQMK
jgi:hypothetical protein